MGESLSKLKFINKQRKSSEWIILPKDLPVLSCQSSSQDDFFSSFNCPPISNQPGIEYQASNLDLEYNYDEILLTHLRVLCNQNCPHCRRRIKTSDQVERQQTFILGIIQEKVTEHLLSQLTQNPSALVQLKSQREKLQRFATIKPLCFKQSHLIPLPTNDDASCLTRTATQSTLVQLSDKSGDSSTVRGDEDDVSDYFCSQMDYELPTTGTLTVEDDYETPRCLLIYVKGMWG